MTIPSICERREKKGEVIHMETKAERLAAEVRPAVQIEGQAELLQGGLDGKHGSNLGLAVARWDRHEGFSLGVWWSVRRWEKNGSGESFRQEG